MATKRDMQPKRDVANYKAAEAINIVKNIATSGRRYRSYNNPNNLVTGDEFLKGVGEAVVEEFNSDLASRQEWEARLAWQYRFLTGMLPEKNEPWPNASNVCIPFITTACIQFQARSYGALMPPKGAVKVRENSDADLPRARRVERYMNHQIYNSIPAYEEGFDKSLIRLPLAGSVFRKVIYDTTSGTVRVDDIHASDVVVNYAETNIDEAARVTHILGLHRSDVNARVLSGAYYLPGGIAEVDKWTFDGTTVSSDLKEAVDEAGGTTLSGGTTRAILEQHRWLDIDGDGIDEPYVVTVDYETKKVLRITSRLFYDKFNRPQVISYFRHYVFIPNPEGFYGLGLGSLLFGLNEAANAIINEIIDAGHLANTQGGFVARRSGITRGDLTFTRGEYKEVDAYVDDLRKAIFNMDFKGPNQTLYAVLGLLYEHAKLVSSVSETMTGQLPASDTPASTVMALIEEGRKVFSAIHKRIHRALKGEFRALYRLNSIFLNEAEYIAVLGDLVGTIPQGWVPADDFAADLGVFPSSDPEIVSKAERMLKAQEALRVVASSPLTANNQEALYNATVRYLEELDIPNMKEVFPPPEPPRDIQPEEENSMILQGNTVQALPEQDHKTHIAVHEGLRDGPYGVYVEGAVATNLDRHIQQHVGLMYLADVKGGGE